VSPREGAIEAVASKIECGPAGYCKFCAERAVDAILDYLSDERFELCYQLDLDYATVEGLIAALRIQENQP
jgi:hypothetical protein